MPCRSTPPAAGPSLPIRVGTTGGSILWFNLALFGSSLLLAARLEMRARVASVWPSVHSYALYQTWPRGGHRFGLIASELERRTINSVAFGCISLHFPSLRTLILTFSRGRRNPTAFAGTTSFIRVTDACNQCKGWGGDGAMGCCRRLGLARPIRGCEVPAQRGNDGGSHEF